MISTRGSSEWTLMSSQATHEYRQLWASNTSHHLLLDITSSLALLFWTSCHSTIATQVDVSCFTFDLRRCLVTRPIVSSAAILWCDLFGRASVLSIVSNSNGNLVGISRNIVIVLYRIFWKVRQLLCTGIGEIWRCWRWSFVMLCILELASERIQHLESEY